MSKVQVGSIEIAYSFSGPETAPVILFAHGLAANRAMWRRQTEAFAPRFRCLSYDLRGHGASAAPGGEYAIDQLADDAIGLLDALAIEQAHLVGLSLGGMIGQSLAARHAGRLRSLALCATASRMDPAIWEQRIAQARRGGMESLAQGTVERWLTAPFRARHPDIVRDLQRQVASTSVQGYTGCAAAIRDMDLRPVLGRIEAPTLVLVGAEDQSTPVSAAEGIHKAVRDSTLTVIPDAAHFVNIEAAGCFNEALGAFLSLWSDGAGSRSRPSPPEVRFDAACADGQREETR